MRKNHAPLLTPRAAASLSAWVHTEVASSGKWNEDADERLFWAMADALTRMDEAAARECVAGRKWAQLKEVLDNSEEG